MKPYNIYNYVIICLGVLSISSCVSSAGDKSVRSDHAEKSPAIEQYQVPMVMEAHAFESGVSMYDPMDWADFEKIIGIIQDTNTHHEPHILTLG